jgi:tetratricopeptide (TPR) repeat protein
MRTLATYLLIFSFIPVFFHCGKPHKADNGDLDSVILSRADSNLLAAQQSFKTDSSEENFIWLGRRLAYLNRYDDAIQIYNRGIKQYPDSYKLYRHRGHRHISIRKFDKAINDLQRAAKLIEGKLVEIEPDGMPNKLNIPLSTTQFNVWYHLALAYYLQGDYQNAIKAYQSCMAVSNNADLLVATTDWYFMTLRRMGNKSAAEEILKVIPDSLNIIENDSYYKRLKMYQGKLPADSLLNPNLEDPNFDLNLATQGYGVGNWYLYNGDSAQARQIFQKVVSGQSKSAFGYIAAEADLNKFFK